MQHQDNNSPRVPPQQEDDYNDLEMATATHSEATTTTERESTVAIANVVVLLDNEDQQTVPSSSSSMPPLHSDAVVNDDIPVVQAVFDEGISDDAVRADTIRLDSTHIVSVRDVNPRGQPEFSCVILVNRQAYADFEPSQDIMGLTLQKSSSSRSDKLSIAKIHPDSPFANTCMQVGHVLMSINQTTCHNMDPDAALATLLGALTSTRSPTTTLRLHYEEGAPSLVATTVEKVTPASILGVSFGVNARGSIILSNVTPTGILANSLLNPRDRVLSVNQQDVTMVTNDATLVKQLIQKAQRFVTIVTETTMSTGVVIATGDVSFRPNTQTARPDGTTPDTTTTSTTTSPSNERQGRNNAVAVIMFFVILIIVVGVGVTMANNNQDDDFGFDDFGYDYFTFSPTTAPAENEGCMRATTIPIDGTVVRGNNSYSPVASDSAFLCCSSICLPGTWYKFSTSEYYSFLKVGVCSDSLEYAVVTLYEGNSCGDLSCISHTMYDGCGAAPSLSVTAFGFNTYYVLVQGTYGMAGTFNIKVEEDLYGPDNGTCQCNF